MRYLARALVALLAGCNLADTGEDELEGARLVHAGTLHPEEVVHRITVGNDNDSLGYGIWIDLRYRIYKTTEADSNAGFVFITHWDDSIRIQTMKAGGPAAYDWYSQASASMDSVARQTAFDSLQAVYNTYHSLPTGSCKVTLNAVAAIPSGADTLDNPLFFKSPINPFPAAIIDEARSKPQGHTSVDWEGLPVHGSYTIDCPDPR